MRVLLATLVILYSITHTSIVSAARLYPGEQLLEINQVQTLVKFTKGDADKPLIVFVPGDSHLARIAYGYPEGQEKDFLAYWLAQKGYSFLAVSYPSDNPVYSKTYPAFTITDWGNLTAAVASKFIKENQLSHHIVVLGWSMGGSIEETVNVAAKKNGLTLDVFIGLAAVPPLPAVMQVTFGTDKMLPSKLADRTMLPDIFYGLVTEQSRNSQHEIISKDIYVKEFLGNFPTALSAEGYYYVNGKFTHDINRTLQDGGFYNFSETPWIGLIKDDAASTAKISLIDPAGWNFLRAEMVYTQYLSKNDLTKLSNEKWNNIQKLVESLPEQLTRTIHGNHFFIIGERSAKQTVYEMELIMDRVMKIRNQL